MSKERIYRVIWESDRVDNFHFRAVVRNFSFRGIALQSGAASGKKAMAVAFTLSCAGGTNTQVCYFEFKEAGNGGKESYV